MSRERTFAEVTRQAAHRSLFRDRLVREAGSPAVDPWLVEEANLRGWFRSDRCFSPRASAVRLVTHERLVVGLLMPHGPLDVRLFELVLRVLRSGALAPRSDRVAPSG